MSAEFHHVKGLRFVIPYFERFTLKAKKSWVGRSLVDCYAEEFYCDKDTVRRLLQLRHVRIASGTIDETPSNYIIKKNDVVKVWTPWTEHPVLADARLNIRRQPQQDRFVIEKPVSIPVHKCSHFRKNTMEYSMLSGAHCDGAKGLATRGKGAQAASSANDAERKLWINNRIDRCASGLLLVSDTLDDVRYVNQSFMNKQVHKMYLARVTGMLNPVACAQSKEGVQYIDGVLHVRAPLQQLRSGLWKVAGNKDAVDQEQDDDDVEKEEQAFGQKKIRDQCYSIFLVLGYDETTNQTLLAATPVSGKSRQLREHARYLGHPIVGDEQDPDEVLESQNGFNMWQMRWSVIDSLGLTNGGLFVPRQHNGPCRDWPRVRAALLEHQTSRVDEYLQKQYSICLHAYSYEHSSDKNFSYRSEKLPSWVSASDDSGLRQASSILQKHRQLAVSNMAKYTA